MRLGRSAPFKNHRQPGTDGTLIGRHFYLRWFNSLTVNWIVVRIGAMTMIYVKALRDAFDRARDGIAEPRVFDNDAVMGAHYAFERACADASHLVIVNNPRVVAACAALIDAEVAMLFARANAYAAEGSFFRMLSAHRGVYRTGKVAAEALGTIDVTIRDAWIAAEGFDPRDQASWRKAMLAACGISEDKTQGARS